MIGVSTSAYNNPPLCVPYPAAIAAFIKKHGDNAAEAIWKDTVKKFCQSGLITTAVLRLL
jgi:hypothetical protein